MCENYGALRCSDRSSVRPDCHRWRWFQRWQAEWNSPVRGKQTICLSTSYFSIRSLTFERSNMRKQLSMLTWQLESSADWSRKRTDHRWATAHGCTFLPCALIPLRPLLLGKASPAAWNARSGFACITTNDSCGLSCIFAHRERLIGGICVGCAWNEEECNNGISHRYSPAYLLTGIPILIGTTGDCPNFSIAIVRQSVPNSTLCASDEMMKANSHP